MVYSNSREIFLNLFDECRPYQPVGFWDIYLLAGEAGIFNSRIGSFLGSELWRAGWLGGLLVIVGWVVGFRLLTAAGY